jgi:hypothetical protein
MKYLFSIISYCFIGLSFSQAWRTINQSDYNVKYKLPSSWEIDGFGSGFGYWDEGGSSVCDCAGTINYGYDRKLGMVLYPYSNLSAEDSVMVKRDYVWDYHFNFTSASDAPNYVTKKLTFQKKISKWEQADVGKDYLEMLDDEVWWFTVSGENYGLIIYFWGDETLMRANETDLYKILDSMVMVKK